MAEIITKNEFLQKVLKTDNVVLVDFFASWCGPCQSLMPVLDDLSHNLPEGTVIYKVDVDNDPDLAGEYGVMSIPSLKVFKGGKVVEEAMGVQSKDNMLKMLTKHLGE